MLRKNRTNGTLLGLIRAHHCHVNVYAPENYGTRLRRPTCRQSYVSVCKYFVTSLFLFLYLGKKERILIRITDFSS